MKAKKKLILIGAGGHCNSCIDVIEQENKYRIVGLIDKKKKFIKKIKKNEKYVKRNIKSQPLFVNSISRTRKMHY